MDNLINLRDLLNHEILDLYSAEKQIIDALPDMIDNAGDEELRSALAEHLEVTRTHKTRLEKVQQLLGQADATDTKKEDGFFSRLFGGVSEPKCRGTEGLIKESEKMMAENMSPEVRDAAIIAGAQKIEHYEISGYGTAVAFARQLGLEDVAALLEETLNDEYEADDMLTELAVGKLNLDAEDAADDSYDDNVSGTNVTEDFQSSAGQNTRDESLFSDIGGVNRNSL